MALGVSRTVSLDGVVAHLVEVEANVGPGLPGIHIIGSTDSSINQARSRIKTAVANSGLPWPKTKIVVSMSPAALPKSGAYFDVAVALAILGAATKEASFFPPETMARRLAQTLFLGELGLDGTLRPVPGVLAAVLAAQQAGIKTLVLPPGNAAEATLVDGIQILIAHTLKEAYGWTLGEVDLETATAANGRKETEVRSMAAGTTARLDFADIAGQHDIKQAAEVAAAGRHHMLMIGPPGAGKSMIAARMPTIMPPLSLQHTIEATAIHSLTGTPGRIVHEPPFIAPHASVTKASLLGGGSGRLRPGAVSLAHHGILFLDEVSEIAAPLLDSLRAPLEEGEIRLSRAARDVSFPARFQLVMAANPCRCAAEDPSACRCSPRMREKYLKNVSGPLRDRLDMVVQVSAPTAQINTDGEETSATIAQRVAQARERSAARWHKLGCAARTNAEVPATFLRRHALATPSAMALISAYLAEGELTQRGVDRTLKLAWTLCDLDGHDQPDVEHVARALELRGKELSHVAV